ncbi:MAG: hypothetical protein WC117_01185 [Sphaerochaetaceae bacterium]
MGTDSKILKVNMNDLRRLAGRYYKNTVAVLEDHRSALPEEFLQDIETPLSDLNNVLVSLYRTFDNDTTDFNSLYLEVADDLPLFEAEE